MIRSVSAHLKVQAAMQGSPPDVHQGYCGNGGAPSAGVASPADAEPLVPDAATHPHHLSSGLSSPADVPSLRQQQQQPQHAQHTDASASPASMSPDGTPQQNALLNSTAGGGLPNGTVRIHAWTCTYTCCVNSIIPVAGRNIPFSAAPCLVSGCALPLGVASATPIS